MHQFFATCPRGLEDVLAAELQGLGAQAPGPVPGGVAFTGDWAECYQANLESRVATRILWRVGHGRYRRESDIYTLAYETPWPQWFDVERTLRVFVTAIRSPLKSLDFITLRIKDAVCDRFRAQLGRRPSVDTVNPDVRIHAFLTEQEATLYLDTSGAPLYKRGFRQVTTEAPLKENLAAGILHLTGWHAGEALLDPMCGGGTFLLEGALMALDIAPGLGRGFGFERLSGHDASLWTQIRSQAESRRRPVSALPIHGGDLYGEQLKLARTNLAAAGLDTAVTLKQANALEFPPPAGTGVLVANPPYGVRLGGDVDLGEFYRQLGDAFKQKYAGWRCYLLSADPLLPKKIGLRASRRTPLFNGALECRLFEYRMISGSLRPTKEA